MILQELKKRNLIQPPKWLPDNCAYITMMGSQAYAVSSDTSDEDLYGFCLPPKEMVFPHLAGEIPGFGTQLKRFDVWQQHGIKRSDNKTEYDFAIYSIVRYFQLCMENNPNMIDSLFTPISCIKHITPVGQIARDNRKLFLHKGCWHKFRGYAHSQLAKAVNKNPKPGSKRYELIKKHGVDTKFLYHVARLGLECEMILAEGDLDLTRSKEFLKAIRRGDRTFDQVKEWFEKKEGELETLYINSKLPHSPDETIIKNLLIDCLEQHYGSISKIVTKKVNADNLIREIENIIAKYK